MRVIENVRIYALPGPAWDRWLEANWRAAHDPFVVGAVEHILVVARNPGWRAVVRHIAAVLVAASIPYTVVGGTSAALQGVPVHVKDIDIQTTAEGAYQFAELFSAQNVAPVSLSDNGVYRSHFGRFDFDGVEVEIMGAQERWQDGQWVDTMTGTEASVDLDGVSISVPWLEEECLAYIRRGRLDRAALLLPHCNRERFLALLRGQVKTHVL